MPEQCNARIEVGGETWTCSIHDELSMFPHQYATFGWDDRAPGAVPHTPTCRDCEQSHREWQQAIVAQQEACRERDDARVEVSKLRERLAAAEGSAAHWHDKTFGLRDDVRYQVDRAIRAENAAVRNKCEADRYRTALTVIADHPWPASPGSVAADMKSRAREALEGVSRD